MILKAQFLSDQKSYVINLPRGAYTINGKPLVLEQKQELVVNDISNIRPITINNVVIKYAKGNDILTIDQYNTHKENLLKKSTDNGYSFEELEDEYQYKKFIRDYQPIHKQIDVASDPIDFEVLNTSLKTDNDFIHSVFSLTGVPSDLFCYKRYECAAHIIRSTFNELGMKCVTNVDYKQTKNKKIWSNPNSSSYRYIQAFGTFVNLEQFEKPKEIRGTWEQVIKRYNDDVKNIRDQIITKYNLHFSNMDINRLQVEKMFNKVERLIDLINDIDSTDSSTDNWNIARSAAVSLLSDLKEAVNNQNTKQ